ncbi:iron-sulfur cluster-binding domain-containing protein [Chitinophaga ginsengisoli]|uniref:Ring-1,2-phenylacetyl-CoA epoxidase subunit PaaE n=1 Tax=Chitinophaga ginsengisoli TaxID=363837 RepID=A0A2P8FLL2_9BACT|nr:iron-sulfur cluster-binding domain-containing protein [Chitinophaga ginsengisoli]PSL22610.1 ring-1,2-phenylacetyl-CoA epoxidase subunit PaaE [Chitinophaga ginsengisoli]
MDELYIHLRIREVIAETQDAFTYRLETIDGRPLAYQAGQFITFLIYLHGTEYRRSYSFSSAPGIDPYPSVTIREKQNGEISRHILHYWKAGDQVTALLPSGRFTLPGHTSSPRDIFLLGAGSGITPLFSLLKDILHNEPGAHIKLIYSNTSEERTIFHKHLQELAKQFPQQLHIILLFSNDSEHMVRRLSNLSLEPLVQQQLRYRAADAQFFVCGPPEYMRMILLTLTYMGFEEEQLHKENFVVNTAPQLARIGTPEDSSMKNVELHLRGGVHKLSIPGNHNILGEALAQGIAIPYSCKGGVCGSCTARCTKGEVWMALNEVLTDKEIEQGFVLTCTGYAVSAAVVIEI